MNRKPFMLLIYFILALPLAGFAAPVGNIGDPMLWNPGPFQTKGGLSIITTLTCDRQINRLPDQITRFPWTNPDTFPPEQRHYTQTRSSKNTLNNVGLKMGFPFNDRVFPYAVMGSTTAAIDFRYADWTVSRSHSSHNTFESDPSIYYGLGTSIIMHREEYDTIPLTMGMDISYRRYAIEEDRINAEGLSYSSKLDEIQLAFSLSAEMKLFSPYIGIKVASITGSEDYTDMNYSTDYFKEGYIHYTEDITWSKNLGYFMGATTSIKDLVTVGLEIRGGDENAIGINATTKF